jgi:hypothetical protein
LASARSTGTICIDILLTTQLVAQGATIDQWNDAFSFESPTARLTESGLAAPARTAPRPPACIRVAPAARRHRCVEGLNVVAHGSVERRHIQTMALVGAGSPAVESRRGMPPFPVASIVPTA